MPIVEYGQYTVVSRPYRNLDLGVWLLFATVHWHEQGIHLHSLDFSSQR